MRIARARNIRRPLVLFVVLALLLLPASAAFAANPGYTLTEHGTRTFTDVAPCGPAQGSDYDITADYNSIIHFSPDAAGGGHFTLTEEATFTAMPSGGTGPTYSGHYTVWDGGNVTAGGASNDTMIFVVQAKGSDGSTIRFTEVAHVSVSATGVTVSFDRPVCH